MALNILHPGKITETTKATQVEAVAGADNRKYMTPLRTKQSLGVEIGQAIEAVAGQYDDVLAVQELPQTGVAGRLYIVGAIAYHWNGTDYDQIGFSSTDELSEGTGNLYFTAARAAAAAPVQSVAGKTGAVTLATSDIASERVSFEITGSHPAVEGFYDIWDIELTSGRFRWANSNAAAEGATWTALRWNANRWELGSYTAFTTWTPLYFNTNASDIPPSAGWQPLASHPAGTIFVSGAGTPAANGTYTPSGTLFGNPPRPTYTGPDGFSILWNGLYWSILQGGDPLYFNGVQFEAAPTPDLVAAWTRTGSGTSPAPAVTLPPPHPTLQWFSQPASVEIAALYARASRLQKQFDDQGSINTAALAGKQPAGSYASASSLATLESSLGTLSQQNADAASITGGTAYFDTLEAATAHAATEGTLTISAAGDILGSGANKLLGFVAGGATY
jgi:hypothetical protein